MLNENEDAASKTVDARVLTDTQTDRHIHTQLDRHRHGQTHTHTHTHTHTLFKYVLYMFFFKFFFIEQSSWLFSVFFIHVCKSSHVLNIVI